MITSQPNIIIRILVTTLSLFWLLTGLPIFGIIPFLLAIGIKLNHELVWLDVAFIRTILMDSNPTSDASPQLTPAQWWSMIVFAFVLTALAIYSVWRVWRQESDSIVDGTRPA
jgi:hypothetical protein